MARFLGRLRIVIRALSLGGVESLMCVPSRTSHRTLSPEERQRAGIAHGLIRLSVGIKDLADIIAYLTTALEEKTPAR